MTDWIQETLQENGVLKNKWAISNKETLEKVEEEIYWIKAQDILEGNYKITSIEDLKLFHELLFSELYDWAGEYRPGNFGKNRKQFFPRKLFDRAEINLNQQIKHIITSSYKSKIAFANDLARLLLDINEFHPFREGNGRTQRLFIRILASQKGYELHISKNSAMYDRYMSACINDDMAEMTDILADSL